MQTCNCSNTYLYKKKCVICGAPWPIEKVKAPSRVSMTVDDAEDLLTQYDAWKGSLHPDEQDAYIARFDKLRKRIKRLQNTK